VDIVSGVSLGGYMNKASRKAELLCGIVEAERCESDQPRVHLPDHAAAKTPTFWHGMFRCFLGWHGTGDIQATHDM
jgi:hypothetical protein